jgi:8-oxo-dGTP pyrophosphatase MutT (NUDIX family)
MSDLPVIPIERVEVRVTQHRWPFAIERSADIGAHFAELKREKPAVWNGRVLMLHKHAIEDTVFRGDFFETDFASFVAWHRWGFPDDAVKSCFPLGALGCADGYLLGVMGAHTVNSGRIYFPAGTPDPGDIVGDTVDLAGNIRREIAEETGLGPHDYVPEEGWYCVPAGPRIALLKLLRARGTAGQLRRRILNYIAGEGEPELADIRIVRSGDDFDPMMPPYITAFLNHVWSTGAA